MQIFLKLYLKLEFLRNFSTIFRSSRQRCSIEKAIVKNLAKLTGKQLWWSFFNKVKDLQVGNFIKNRLQRRLFL